MLQQVKTFVKKIPGTYRFYKFIKNIDLNLKIAPLKTVAEIKAEFIEKAIQDLERFLNSEGKLVFPENNSYSVSIVIPVYNKAYFTYGCLRNLAKFKELGLEIIIINNNSSDSTSALLKKISGIKIIDNSQNLHFLKASNQGANLACGEFLLFLNNDAEPEPGAIQTALETFKNYDKVGAVGAKIILPDRTLQEAGSLIWSDGCCQGYGRGDDPNSGKYNFIREVDFCSGAFLMIPRELFLKYNCFDEQYSPAYYEECDFCVTLKENGFKTIYNPGVVIKHFEFGSSELSQHAFELMECNRKKFLKSKKVFLAKKFEKSSQNLFKASNLLEYKKRILYIDERLPQIKTGAGYPRANAIVNLLTELNCYVTVYPLIYTDPKENWSNIRTDLSARLEVAVFDKYGESGFKDFYEERKDFYDIIIISRPTTMEAVRKISPDLSMFAGKKVIYDAEALFTLRDLAVKKLNNIPVSDQEKKELIAKELSIAKDCTAVICVSKQEASHYFENGFKNVNVLGHCRPVIDYPREYNKTSNLLFVGAFHADYTPNADSMVWFVGNVMQKFNKQISLNIVGINHSSQVIALSGSRVKVIGAVPDLADWFLNSRVFVAPTRFAAGIPLKVVEAASYGIPCVVSKLIHEQLGWENEHDYLVADTPEEFVVAIERVYYDQELWKKLSLGGLEKIRSEYSIDNFKEILQGLI